MIPILITDGEAKIIYTNDALCRLIDCDPDQLLGQSIYDFLDPGFEDFEARFKASSDKSPSFHTATFNTPKGGKIELTFKMYPVVNLGSDEILYHVTVAVHSKLINMAISQDDQQDRLRENYRHTSLSYDDGKELFKKVEHLMTREKLFQNADLDLEALSKRLATNQLYLSQTINFFAGTKFRDYINHHRIRYLTNNRKALSDLTITSLWKTSGFGSYSAFRRYLLQAQDLTPKQFAAKLKSNESPDHVHVTKGMMPR